MDSQGSTHLQDRETSPGPVLLLGAPGVGKGTQAKLLMAEYKVPQISTGDILRDQIRRDTPLGHAAKELMDCGQLVPDEVVNAMVKDRLAQADAERGYILDGFPRTLAQAEWLDQLLAPPEPQSAVPGELDLVAVSLRVDDKILLERITGRRSCSQCGHIYNVYSHPPAREGVCDLDGSSLVQRSDDTESAFVERMKAYELSTAPVIAHYRERERFAEVDGMAPVAEVTEAIRRELQRLRQWEGR